MVAKKAVVVNDEIVIRSMMNMVYSIDHRYGDAAILGQFTKIMKDILEDPETFNIDNYTQPPSYEEMEKARRLKATAL